MFKSKKSIKIKTKQTTEANALNEETENNTTIDETNIDRIYMNLPIQVNADEQFYSPPTVKVKHSIDYEYDNKRFEIIKDECLYLINRTNQDWWLCLRLDDNLTFFVPASYVHEMDSSHLMQRPSLLPPPRPPPPPPKLNHDDYKPEVKQRMLLNAAERKLDYSAAEAIINDLEEHLEREEASYSELNTSVNKHYENLEAKVNLNEEEDDVDEEEYDEECDEELELQEKQLLLEKLDIPLGWKMCMSGCKRHVFYNEITREIWYLNYDVNGKHYFYNKEGASVWQLKELNLNDDDSSKETSTHFQKNFDDNLETFNNLYSRLSIRKRSNEASATSMSFSTLNDSLSEMTKSSSKSKTSESNNSVNNSTNKSLSVPNENFKCIKLIENGKKLKKKSSDELRVFLTHSKIVFVKALKGGIEKLEYSIDMKNARCYSIDSLRTNVNINTKDKNNNQSLSFKSKSYTSSSSSSSTTKRDKETEELLDLVTQSKSALIIENYQSIFRILLINENVNIVNEWVSSINAIINQISDSTSEPFEPLVEPVTNSSKSRTNTSKKVLYLGNIEYKQDLGFLTDLTDEDQDVQTDKLLLLTPNCLLKRIFTNNTRTKSTLRPILYSQNRASESFKLFDQDDDEDNQNLLNYVTGTQMVMSPPPLPDGPPPPSKVVNSNVFRNILIKNFLNLFLNRRPPIEQLKNKGIIQECIFGSNLINLCHKENRTNPLFVEEIIACIEYRGLDVDGIYRISGNLAEVQKVRFQVDHGKNNFKDFDIHVLCGALKTFFRELEEPLIPFSLHQEFLNSITISDKVKRFEKIKDLIRVMPVPHRDTLTCLSKHLLKVIEQSSLNRMTIQNIALVFGPNIMRSNPINDTNNGFNPNIMTQNILVEYLLTNFKELFF